MVSPMFFRRSKFKEIKIQLQNKMLKIDFCIAAVFFSFTSMGCIFVKRGYCYISHVILYIKNA